MRFFAGRARKEHRSYIGKHQKGIYNQQQKFHTPLPEGLRFLKKNAWCHVGGEMRGEGS